MPHPTSAEDNSLITLGFRQLANLMSNLWCRWQDEHKYEDIRDYGAVVQQNLPAGWHFVKMNKRPFGFEFNIGTPAKYVLEVTAKQYRWHQLS
jgi:hypothetical protein